MRVTVIEKITEKKIKLKNTTEKLKIYKTKQRVKKR